jgi:hypothetical protein
MHTFSKPTHSMYDTMLILIGCCSVTRKIVAEVRRVELVNLQLRRPDTADLDKKVSRNAGSPITQDRKSTQF